MTMTPEQLAALKEVAEAATQGKRVATGNGIHIGTRCVATTHAYDLEQRYADAKQIAAFDPTTCLALLEKVERLAKENRCLSLERSR